MFEVSVVMSFSAAHHLRAYRGKCEALHGHNWKVEAALQAKELDGSGMVADFSDIKEKMRGVLALLDHAYLNEVAPFDKVNPTSENIARFIFRGLRPALAGKRVRVAYVKVWETETSAATYRE